MRKAWLLLLVVALTAVGVSAFADGAWTAWNQGNFYPYISFDSNTGFAGWGPNYDANGGIDQEWTFAYSGKNYGFNMTTEFGNTATAGQTFGGISWFGTWYKFADVVKVTLGMPRIGDYQQFTVIEGANWSRFGDSNWGGYVQITPMAGLSIGAVMYVPGYSATLMAPKAGVGASGNGAGVALQYALPDLVTLQAQFKAIDFSKAIQVGANVTALKGMTLLGAVNVDFSDSSNTIFGVLLSGKTAFDPISLAADVKLVSNPKAAKTFAYGAEVQAEYAMGMYSLGAQIGYDLATGLFNGNVGDWGGFELWPYVKANFDNGSYFKVGFLYSSGMGTDSGFATWNGITTAQKSVIAIPIVYVWAF
jgi:hypothetical protein